MAEIEVRAGRQAASYTDIKDWVALSGVSPKAVVLYQLLRMHVNRKRGDDKSRPTTDTLAMMMCRGRGDKISAPLAELVALGAIEAERVGLAGRYIYTVHQEPPRGYAGAVNLAQWYDAHRAELEAQRTRAKAVRDERRTAQRAKNPQVSPVTPKSGEQGDGPAVTPKTGELVTPISGHPVTPISGREPDVVEPDVVEPPPVPPAAPPAASVPGQRTGGGNDLSNNNPDPGPALGPTVDDVVAEVRAIRPAWSASSIRRVLAEKLEEGHHPWPLVAQMMRRVAADEESQSPFRLRAVPDSWWHDKRRPVAAATRPPWCGECVEASRMVDPARLAYDDPAAFVGGRCPSCHPESVGQAA